jgi:O-methyltransferase
MKRNQGLCVLLDNCITNYMLDFERGCSLVYHLLQCQNIAGDIVEFGTYTGCCAILMASISPKPLWLYDSFQGLPEKQAVDGDDANFRAGVLRSTEDLVKANFQKAKLRQPMIINKWFKNVTDSDLPEKIAFAHLDGDFYQSIRDSLRLVYPRMARGGIVLIDDYNHLGLPGVKLATDEFLGDKLERLIVPFGVNGPDGPRQGPEGVMLHALFIKG